MATENSPLPKNLLKSLKILITRAFLKHLCMAVIVIKSKHLHELKLKWQSKRKEMSQLKSKHIVKAEKGNEMATG